MLNPFLSSRYANPAHPLYISPLATHLSLSRFVFKFAPVRSLITRVEEGSGLEIAQNKSFSASRQSDGGEKQHGKNLYDYCRTVRKFIDIVLPLAVPLSRSSGCMHNSPPSEALHCSLRATIIYLFKFNDVYWALYVWLMQSRLEPLDLGRSPGRREENLKLNPRARVTMKIQSSISSVDASPFCLIRGGMCEREHCAIFDRRGSSSMWKLIYWKTSREEHFSSLVGSCRRRRA